MHHYQTMTDGDLVCLYQSGEERAFEELLRRYKNRVFSTIFYMVKDREVAEDLFQDTFTRVVTKLTDNRYTEEGKFAAWLLRIAHNIVIDYFRKENHMKMIREVEGYSLFDGMNAKHLNPEEELIQKEKILLVRNLIECLPEHQRRVVILRHYGGLKFKEIAEVLGLNLNTVLTRMHLAVLAMREKQIGRRIPAKKREKECPMPEGWDETSIEKPIKRRKTEG